MLLFLFNRMGKSLRERVYKEYFNSLSDLSEPGRECIRDYYENPSGGSGEIIRIAILEHCRERIVHLTDSPKVPFLKSIIEGGGSYLLGNIIGLDQIQSITLGGLVFIAILMSLDSENRQKAKEFGEIAEYTENRSTIPHLLNLYREQIQRQL